MRFALLLLHAVLLGAGLANSAAADPVADARGRWTGTAAAPVNGAMDLRLDGGPESFRLTVKGPAGALIDAEFRAGQRKDVFGEATSKGLLARLGIAGDARGADGKPIAWARREGGELIVYRLEWHEGTHRLDRLVLAPAGGRLNVAFERREHNGPPERFTATLERSKP